MVHSFFMMTETPSKNDDNPLADESAAPDDTPDKYGKALDVTGFATTSGKLVPTGPPEPPDSLWKAVLTVKEMLIDRGFTIPLVYDQIKQDNIAKYVKENEIGIIAHRTLTHPSLLKEECYVFFDTEEPKLGIKKWREYIDKMNENAVARAIIVTEHGITPKVAKELSTLEKKSVHVFDKKSLYHNITRHAAVPKHRVLNEEEVIALCKNRMLRRDAFPTYAIDDPIIQYYGYEKGAVVEIQRHMGGNQPVYKTYRMVE